MSTVWSLPDRPGGRLDRVAGTASGGGNRRLRSGTKSRHKLTQRATRESPRAGSGPPAGGQRKSRDVAQLSRADYGRILFESEDARMAVILIMLSSVVADEPRLPQLSTTWPPAVKVCTTFKDMGTDARTGSWVATA